MTILATRAASPAAYCTSFLDPRRHAGLVVTALADGFETTARIVDRNLLPDLRNSASGGYPATSVPVSDYQDGRSNGAVAPLGNKKPMWVWQEFRPALNQWVHLAQWRLGVTPGSARYREPYAWRPHPDHPWSEPLAALLPPLRPARAAVATAPAPLPPEPIVAETDDWPHPGLRLGRGDGEPPASIEETEARVLRAIRLEHTFANPGIGHRAFCADIPRHMVEIARKYADEMRRRELRQEGKAEVLDALPSVWLPTRRDRDDYVTAAGWLIRIEARLQRIVRARAANPIMTWREIAERWRMSPEGARRAYRAGMEAMFRIARGRCV